MIGSQYSRPEEELFAAVYADNLEEAMAILSRHKPTFQDYAAPYKIISAAVINGNEPMVQELLLNDSILLNISHHQNQALLLAIQLGHIGIARHFLEINREMLLAAYSRSRSILTRTVLGDPLRAGNLPPEESLRCSDPLWSLEGVIIPIFKKVLNLMKTNIYDSVNESWDTVSARFVFEKLLEALDKCKLDIENYLTEDEKTILVNEKNVIDDVRSQRVELFGAAASASSEVSQNEVWPSFLNQFRNLNIGCLSQSDAPDVVIDVGDDSQDRFGTNMTLP